MNAKLNLTGIELSLLMENGFTTINAQTPKSMDDAGWRHLFENFPGVNAH